MTPAPPPIPTRLQPSASTRGLFGRRAATPGHAVARELLGSHLLLCGQVLSAMNATDPVRVRVLAGEVWITEEGDPHDHVRVEGQSWQSTVRGRVVVEAVSPAAQVVLS